MSGLVLLRPWWLCGLLAAALAALWLRRRRLGADWAGVTDPALLPVLRRLGLVSDGRRDGSALLALAAAGLLSLALAGPALMRPGAIAYRALDPLILVLDLSPSVVAGAAPLNDLKAAAARILTGANGRPVGIMVYAADAYLASAPTSDADSLQGLVAVLARDTMPVAGSRPDIALSMARDLFRGKDGPGLGGADLVVISDGGGVGERAAEEAARLASDGARVWALSLPRVATGAPAPDHDGLAALARRGKGAALPAADVAQLLERIAAARDMRLARDPATRAAWRDLGPWLLPFVLAALWPLFRRLRG